MLIKGRMKGLLQEKEEQRRKGLEAEAVTNINGQVAAAVLLQGVLGIRAEREEGQPAWSSKVDKSHDSWHGGGIVFCRNCGFLGAGERQNLGLYSPCRLAMDGKQTPLGSKYRLERLKRGRHPDPSAGTWPKCKAEGEDAQS